MNWTEIANQGYQAAQNGYSSASGWASSITDAANSKARAWLATTTMSPAQREECLHAASSAMSDMFKCHAMAPNQFGDQTLQRCNCWFKMHLRMQEADCQALEANFTSGSTHITSEYGQIQMFQGSDMVAECEPYYDAWLAAHPEASIFKLFWDWLLAHPGVIWFFLIVLLVILAILFLKYLRNTPWGRQYIDDLNETRKELYVACDEEYAELTEGRADYGEKDYRDKGVVDTASSREVFALQNDDQASLDSEDIPDFRASRSSKAPKRKLKVYQEDSEPDEDEEWQGVGGFFSSLFSSGPAKEQPDSDEANYNMVEEGPSLAELRRQREAEEQAGALQSTPSASSMQAAAAVNSQYHRPPYYDVHRTSEDGHHTVHANPEVLQQVAMRTAQLLPAQPQNIALPFPHERAYGTPPLQGRVQGGQQGMVV